jgi:hypothetical protein
MDGLFLLMGSIFAFDGDLPSVFLSDGLTRILMACASLGCGDEGV